MPLVYLCLLALVVGIVGGLGAVVFRGLIALRSQPAVPRHSCPSSTTPACSRRHRRGDALVILVPVVGAIGVTFIVTNFAPEAKGHGVPEVMDAIYYNRGIIRPIVAVAKSLASALSIGSGAAVGREGPIIQIGSAFGSTLGQVIRMSMGQRIILVAAGAGAGIAATFNTPIGGVLFATELMMPEISVNTFLPVAIATGTATFIGRLFFGDRPAFDVPANLAPLPSRGEERGDPGAVRGARRADRRGGGGVRPRSALVRGSVRQDSRQLPAPRAGHAAGRCAAVRADALGRALLRRGRRLRHHSGDADQPARRRVVPVAAVRLQAAGNLA